ncbi:MAG: folate biosynthesis protein [Deltaproteobacteria bacterium]|nr:folate biosynthesis protein [Deltaproteobacteria bacterium]
MSNSGEEKAMRKTTIELYKEDQKFSAGHFTIFSASERENLHGHNFQVWVSLTGTVDDNGMLFDYVAYKKKIRDLCVAWNETFLLPSSSPFLKIEETEKEVCCRFSDEVLRFLRRDVTLLPVRNVTLEELSRHFGERLTEDVALLQNDGVHQVLVKVASGPGQWASWAFETPRA